MSGAAGGDLAADFGAHLGHQIIVVTLVIYHIHHKMTANQGQIPRDRSQYKHMG